MATQQHHKEEEGSDPIENSTNTAISISEKDGTFLPSLNAKPRGRALDVILVLPSSTEQQESAAVSSSDFIVSFTHTYNSSSFTNLLHHPHGTNHTTTSSLSLVTDKVCGGLASCVHGDLCCSNDSTTLSSPPPPPSSSTSQNNLDGILQHGWKVEVYINNIGPIPSLEMRYLGTKKDVRRIKRRYSHSPQTNNTTATPNTKHADDEKQHCGVCIFTQTKTTKPSSATLSNTILPLLTTTTTTTCTTARAVNSITYILYSSHTTIAAIATSNLYVWSSNDKVICSDIDGTVTKSDVSGVLDTVLFSKFQKEESAHFGICGFYSELERRENDHDGGGGGSSVVHDYIEKKEEEEEKKEVVLEDRYGHNNPTLENSKEGQLRFLYLSSRPLALIEKTKGYLSTLTQSPLKHKLPQGPIFCHSGSVGEVLWTELVKKNIYEFKAGMLVKHVLEVFRSAGRPLNEKLFVAGFGNKKTDAIAYSMAGMKRHDIYIIDKESNIVCLDNYIVDEDDGDNDVHHDYVEMSSPTSKNRKNVVNCCIVNERSMNDAISKEMEEEQQKQQQQYHEDGHTVTMDGANPIMMEAPQPVSMRSIDDEEQNNINANMRQRPTVQQQPTQTSEMVDNPQSEGSFRRKSHSLKKIMPLYEKYIGTTYCGYGDSKLLLDVHEKIKR